MTFHPRRVLLVSATIGEGHNATARAVEKAAQRVWPGCEVSWLDALEVMGRWIPSAFTWIYVTNVEKTPWLYNFFYAALWRYRWFADSSRRFVGAWSGRRLRPLLAQHQPDLIVSTYPLGTAGLEWLRRRGELDIPVTAVISDFSPHPFWVYRDIDQHYVMSEASLQEMRRAEPEAVGAVCAPPVVADFRPTDKVAARRTLGLPEDGFLVLISCGSLGFGSVERAVDAALSVTGVARVVVVCGRNEALRQRIAGRTRDKRLVALGWVDHMADLMAGADVVVSNAGGATALEALACGRTVVMFEPIAGHGRANAELMARAGLAELCPRNHDLVETLQRLATTPDELARYEHRAIQHSLSTDFAEQVAALARLPRTGGARDLRPEDAFFVYATTPAVCQQTGALLRLEGPRMSAQDWNAHLSDLIARSGPELALLTRRLVCRPDRKPQWIPVAGVDPAEHLRCMEVDNDREWHRATRDFFSTPVPTDRPPWQLLLIRDAHDRTALLAKLHHSLGDGVVVTSTLLRLLCGEEVHTPQRDATGRVWYQRIGTIFRGLLSLIGAGLAPASGLEGASSAEREFGWAELPAAKVRASARAHHVDSTVVLLTVVAEALHRYLDQYKGTTPGQRFRIMVPRTTRGARGGPGVNTPGNYTATLAVDLPVGPMPTDQRLTEVAEQLSGHRLEAQPAAAGLVLAMFGRLPAPMHAWVVRRTYQRRFFNAVVSILPGRRRQAYLAGARISGVFPVLSLADGVGLAIGAINWAEMVGFGITADTGLVPDVHALTEHVRAAFEDFQTIRVQPGRKDP